MSGGFRTATGGRIDRARPVNFSFDGRHYRGFAGDTLASALLANGVRLVGRSFKYHRPRGIISAGSEEPNALIMIGEGGRAEPNARATMVELYEGLVAHSQNNWPSLGFDLGAVNDLLSPLFPAGFYYKTFLGSSRRWTNVYEPLIRRMAGLGPTPEAADPDRYDKVNFACDLLVVGAGPAGLAAARAAGHSGASVLLVDEGSEFGGALLATSETIGATSAIDWAQGAVSELATMSDVTMLSRTTAFGRYDDGLVMAVERCTDHLATDHRRGPRQRLWQVRARRMILATGAHEQPVIFHNNDRPGVMLAHSAAAYASRFGVLVGRRIVIATSDDSGYEAAAILSKAGAEIVGIVDAREKGPSDPRMADGLPILAGAVVKAALGRKYVRGAEIVQGGQRRSLACDTILMAGGWQPAVHLHTHVGGKLAFDAELSCFVPVLIDGGPVSVGACAGEYRLAQCIAAGELAGAEQAMALGFAVAATPTPTEQADRQTPRRPVPPQPGTAFVDYQHDVKLGDLDLAIREGFVSVEHLKRYTTTGMATDQGKLSNLNALDRLAMKLDCNPGAVGTTTFRPPYTPVTLGALAAHDRGRFTDPVRVTPMHGWHTARGAVFEDVGQWKRPLYYPHGNEPMHAAVDRECRAVRGAVGMLDGSTLGKIDIQGPDAAAFLNLVYTNAWLKLEVGRCRYGVMCREDGMVFDDGVTARLAEHRYLMTTTSGNAARVFDHLEDYLQTEWPHLKLWLTSVTDHWAVTVVTGPRARDVLARVVTECDLSNEAFSHLSVREARLAGIRARLFRISFSGELAFEVHVAAHDGLAAWEAIAAAGEPFGIMPYGTEALHVLRAEKGFIIIGQETDGSVSPTDLGLGWAVSKAKPDFIGKRSLARPDMLRDDRKQLVGLRPIDGTTLIEEGAQLIECDASLVCPVPMRGYVTSSYRSEAVGGPVALALVERGRARHGDEIIASFGDHRTPCRIVEPMFYDPSGVRMNG